MGHAPTQQPPHDTAHHHKYWPALGLRTIRDRETTAHAKRTTKTTG